MKLLKEPFLDRGGRLVLAAIVVDTIFKERPYLKPAQMTISAGAVAIFTRGTACTSWILSRVKEELPFYSVKLHDEGGESERVEIQVDPERGQSNRSADGRRKGSEAGSVRTPPVSQSKGGS